MVTNPNWTNIKRLRNHLIKLRQTKNRKFDMNQYLRILSGKESGDTVSVGELRKNGSACGSVTCLAGETVIALCTSNTVFQIETSFDSDVLRVNQYTVTDIAIRLLGLTDEMEHYMFFGSWSDKPLARITKGDAIRSIRISYH